MIIDFHTHTFPDKIAQKAIASLAQRSHSKPYTDGTLQGLLQSMRNSNVNCSVILPVVTNPAQTTNINNTAIQINASQHTQNDFFVLSFGGIHPETENYKEELNRLKAAGIKGIKLHPNYQDTYIDDIRYLRIIDYAASLDLIISVHAGVDIGLPEPVYCSPDRILHVWEQIQPDKLVLAHTGGWKLWDMVEDSLAGLPLYFDTSFTFGYIDDEQMKRIVSKHGVDKILFATDSPWHDQKEDILSLQKLQLNQQDEDKILSGNAANLLRLF